MEKLLLAIGLPALMLFTGCSQDPAPTMNTGSYKNAAQLKTCQVATVTSTTPSGRVYLSVQLTTIPQPASGPEVLSVEFMKEAGQPASAYQATIIYLSIKGATSLVFPNETATLTTTGTSLSGTFATGSFFPNSPTIASGITDGVFTNVQL